MLLSDLGADVVRIDRPGPRPALPEPDRDVLNRGRRSVAIDLKDTRGAQTVRFLAGQADALIEPYRPGVAERLGIGPDVCCGDNPRLVYARMTGWGQTGPRAAQAGHDINYAAVAGALAPVGEPGRKPVPALNLVADFGGGAMFAVTGILAALLERQRSGRGQVIDVAMVDGASTLLAMAYSYQGAGLWRDARGSNRLDGGAPFYDTYQCADGEYVAVGALEPQFFAALLDLLDLAGEFPHQNDQREWERMREAFAERFARRSRDEWAAIAADRDACVTPVLWLSETSSDPQLAARETVVTDFGVRQPAAAPRMSRSTVRPGGRPPVPGADTRDVLVEWGMSHDRIDALLAAGVIRVAEAGASR
jgi:alpha-methylacyl-CoA racemase